MHQAEICVEFSDLFMLLAPYSSNCVIHHVPFRKEFPFFYLSRVGITFELFNLLRTQLMKCVSVKKLVTTICNAVL